MIISRKLIDYLDGRHENLTEEDINWYRLMVKIHEPMLVKIDSGTTVDIVEGPSPDSS